jgi:hypothetical protein
VKRVGGLLIVVGVACGACVAAFASQSPRALQASILDTARAQKSVHYVYTSSDHTYPFARQAFVGDAGATSGFELVTYKDSLSAPSHLYTEVVDRTVYAKGDVSGLLNLLLRGGLDRPQARKYAGQWISIPEGDKAYAPNVAALTMRPLVRGLASHGNLSTRSSTLHGKPVVDVHAVTGKGKQRWTFDLYAPANGKKLPLESDLRIANTKSLDRIVLSKWDERLRLTAPAKSVPISTVRASFNPDPIFPVGPISGTVSHQVLKLDRVASALAGRRAIVNCWSQRDWPRFQAWQAAHHLPFDPSGATFLATQRIQLSPFECQILAQVLARSAQQPLYTAFGVTVLAHESAHASGIKAENLAECRAIRTEPRAAMLLGIPTKTALLLQHIYRGTIYPYDLPRYRTPPCKAGLPGALVPDTLGSSANLRPLTRVATAVTRSLPGWRNLEGGDAVGPLDPCAPIKTRTWELARIGESLVWKRAFLGFAAASVRTQKEFAITLSRYAALAPCDLAELRQQIRLSHANATVTSGRIPNSITRLSPDIRAFRQVWSADGEKWNRDTISILDRANHAAATLFFKAPSGEIPVSIEARATAAAIHVLRQDG